MKLDPWKHKEKYLKWKEEIKEVGCVENKTFLKLKKTLESKS